MADIVYNTTKHVHICTVFIRDGEPVSRRRTVCYRTEPGQGICAKTYPEAAKMLKEHNRGYLGPFKFREVDEYETN